MILSRITRALKDQNWLAAGIEFAIVILGVVIGFQVSAWNERRAEIAESQANLALIIGEISRHQEVYERRESSAQGVLDNIRIMADAVAAPESVRDDPGAFMSAIFVSRMRIYTPVNRTAYEGLESSGEIALLPARSTIGEIRAYYHSVSALDLVLAGDYDPWLEYNHAMAGYISADEIERIIMAQGRGETLEDIDPDTAVALARRIASNPEVSRWLPEIESYYGGVIFGSQGLSRQADRVIAMLEEQQGGW
jgi:hypothetical protein